MRWPAHRIDVAAPSRFQRSRVPATVDEQPRQVTLLGQQLFVLRGGSLDNRAPGGGDAARPISPVVAVALAAHRGTLGFHLGHLACSPWLCVAFLLGVYEGLLPH